MFHLEPMRITIFLPGLFCLFLLLHPVSLVDPDKCTNVCPPQSSFITVSAHSFNVTVTWIPFGTGGDSYVVRHRQQNSGLDFVSSPTVSSTTYEIEGLASSTDYEVQVCIVNDTNNCGNCTKCFTTGMEDEPPGAPQNLMLSSSGPQAITVSWTAPTTTSGVTNYIVFYGTLSEGLARNFTVPQVSATINNNILPSTTYVVAVSARNQFGIGPLSDNETVTTESFSTVPGALLVGFEDSITYYPIAEESNVGLELTNIQRFTITNTISKLIDIDYDYRRSHIYITTDNSSIVRYSVSVSINEINARLTINHTSTETLYSGLGDARSITVDWINDRVYWVEYMYRMDGNTSQIYSGSIDGGSVKAHGLPLNGLLDSLTVDPVHGYFYWVIRNVRLVQVNLSVVETAVSSTDLTTSGRVIFSGSLISSFTLDLADSQYYYLATGSRELVQNGLGGNQLGISIAFGMILPTLKTSFGKRAVFAFNNFLVIREASTNTFSQGDHDLNAAISDARMFRSSYQPLPVPPGPATNIKVLAMSNSVLITWDSPEYQADVFGPDAFRAWEYFVDYRSLDSSDLACSSTKSTNITLTSLIPGTTYTFNITVRGITSSESVLTPGQFIFTTFGTSDTPTLLISSDEGVLLSDTLGTNVRYLSSQETDRSTDAVSNALLEPTRYFFCIDQRSFRTQDGEEAMSTSQALDNRNGPNYLQLDWITRKLYWVEQSSMIVRVPTINFTASGQEDLIETFEVEGEGAITDTAIDALNGVFFWTVGNSIKAKTLNNLQSAHTCYTASNNLRALTVDPVNKRLFVFYFNVDVVNVAVLNYTTLSCDKSSFTSRPVPNLSLTPNNALSMAYAANTLYFSQFSSLDIKSISAEFASVSGEYDLALGCIRVEPDEFLPQQLRAISVVLVDNQPLPNGLAVQDTGNETVLAPPPPGTPSLNEATSNTTFIDVTWDPPNFMFSDVFYRVELNLTSALGESRPSVEENILSGNSIQLSNQTFSTTVEARVTPYSLWLPGSPNSNTFQSPAALPAKVQNVRVHVYFPVRSSRELVSAQVVWDGLSVEEAGGMLTSYSINIIDVLEGEPITPTAVFMNRSNNSDVPAIWNGPPFLVDRSTTEFALVLAGFERLLHYPLRRDREYTVNVTAINSAGYGEPSDTVTFYTNASSPPREVLVSSLSGGQVEGEGVETDLPEATPPLAINSQNRTIFFYANATRSLMRGSLDENVNSERLTVLPVGVVPLSFTYDWIGQTLYIVGRNLSDLQVWTVFELNPTPVLLYENSGSVVNEVEVSATIDPFRGFLRWTEYLPSTGSATLQQLNLRDLTTLTSLVSSGTSRKRSVNLDTLSITRALAWDPVSEEVWVCDQNTGDIISCNTSSSAITNCVVRVNASEIVNPTGLPADHLAIDENTVYWSKHATPTVYYVPRSDPTSLQTFSTSDSSFVLLSTSPGQQPFPDFDINFMDFTVNPDCLSPDFSDPNRPVAELVDKTNTTLNIKWEVQALPTSCQNIVFSSLPLTFTVNLTKGLSDNVDGFPRTVFDPMITLSGLEPYTEYSVKIEAKNQYSRLGGDLQFDLFGDARSFRTDEGVPSPVEAQNPTVYGPRVVYLSWDLLEEDELRGNTNSQTFSLYRDSILVSERMTGTSFSFTQLTPNSTHVVEILVSNGVLESPRTSHEFRTLSLPPEPVVDMPTLRNTTLSASVALTGEHSNISSFRICLYNGSSEVSCEMTSPPIEVKNDSAEYPRTFKHSFNSLSPFTVYRLFTNATYSSFNSSNGQLLGPVIDVSNYTEITTAAGVPDAPFISIEDDTLFWDPVDSNGMDIDQYTVFYRPEEETAAPLVSHRFVAEGMSYDLTLVPDLKVGVTYTLMLVARNDIGDSEMSNSLTYTKSKDTTNIFSDSRFVIGIAAGGGFLLFLIFVMLVIMFCCCCCCPKSKSHYAFAPDIELDRLREEYSKSRQIALNPNYIWSRDDYTGYQDDLENINKFPRNKLRLENFIDRGEFGEVYQGTAVDILAPNSGPTPVAVKTMRKGASYNEKEKFLSEAALMSNFNHQNIVKVLGVCLDNDPLYIIMELMPAGDLLKFLREARRDNGPPLLTLAEQVQVAIDVAQGCRYLEQQHFIHRDIAARNCLVSSKGADRVVKIGDFGLAKDLYSSDYYQVEGQRKLPVRWMAPEALNQGKFTIETDIWSYGVLLWEIFTFGNQPYPGRNNQEVVQFITGGGRLDKPENCSIRVYKLMEACWEKYPSERLHFAQIVEYLAHYLDHVNNKRDSYYSDEEDEGEGGDLSRKPSRPSRNSSVRSVGLINLARQGSVRIRRSIRGRSSLHKKEDFDANSQNHTGLNSEENLIDDDRAFRERGPF